MIILVQRSDASDTDPLEVEIDETSQVSYVIAVVSSLTSHSPELISITLNDRVLSPDVVVSCLDLGKVLCFKAILSTNSDSYMADFADANEQRRILAEIHHQRIEENMQYAMEHNPEGFVAYSLLYVKSRINGHPVIVMLDTGAQSSVLPVSAAKTCEVDYLIDRRLRTVTVGVGTQRSVGRIHALQLDIGGRSWVNPFIVLDGPLTIPVLGVDWLTKNRATIDLASRTLVLGDVVVSFETVKE
jgi:predicted aspartyl protease